ncbi:hypothetical protein OHS18_46470 [Amycolatopsis sp. NBC_00355]|uniref:hypothetical protein n=1 Tax=Amycolatopsis sp. NBC_00355 TaxID=2975957 RepID=UPI002E26E245
MSANPRRIHPTSSVSPGPVPIPGLNRDDHEHPGFVMHCEDNTSGHKTYHIHLEAKPGREGARQEFLSDTTAGVEPEPLTAPLFAPRFPKTTFGTFGAFPHANARYTRAYPAQLYRQDVPHRKYDVVLGHQPAPVGALAQQNQHRPATPA